MEDLRIADKHFLNAGLATQEVIQQDALYIDVVVVEDSVADCEGNRRGFGGMFKASKLPSNISITLLMDGLSDGFS